MYLMAGVISRGFRFDFVGALDSAETFDQDWGDLIKLSASLGPAPEWLAKIVTCSV